MTAPPLAPIVAQLPDGCWACFNMPEDSPLYEQTFATRREATMALIRYRTQQVLERDER